VNAAGGGQAPIDLARPAFQPLAEVRTAAQHLGIGWWTVTPFRSADIREADGSTLSQRHGHQRQRARRILRMTGRVSLLMEAAPVPGYRGDTRRALADVRQWLADGWHVVLVTEGNGPASGWARRCAARNGARLGDLDQPPEAVRASMSAPA